MKSPELPGTAVQGIFVFAANFTLNFTARYVILKLKGVDSMPNIKPISDLRNYNEVLRDVEEGSPVFLTKTAAENMPLWNCVIMRKHRQRSV